MKRTRVLLVEDNRLLREGLTAMLRDQTDLLVVASLPGDRDDALKGRKLNPDVVLLDVGLGSQNSLHFVKLFKRNSPNVKVIIMDLIPIQSELVEYVKAGVSGFVLKDATVDEFLRTIRTVAKGTQVLPPPLTGSLFSQIVDHVSDNGKRDVYKFVKMTNREREVVELISEGLGNKEIAGRLNCAIDTVKSHVHNILEKLALHTRLEIATFAHADVGFKSSSRDDTPMPDWKGGKNHHTSRIPS